MGDGRGIHEGQAGRGGPSGRGPGAARPDQQDTEWLRLPCSLQGQGGWLLTLVTFLLMFSRSCSWPRRKHGCWNSVSSRSGLTRPPCSMCTTFRKPSARDGARAAVPRGCRPGPTAAWPLPHGRVMGGSRHAQRCPQQLRGLGVRETPRPRQLWLCPAGVAGAFPWDSGQAHEDPSPQVSRR